MHLLCNPFKTTNTTLANYLKVVQFLPFLLRNPTHDEMVVALRILSTVGGFSRDEDEDEDEDKRLLQMSSLFSDPMIA